MIEVVRTPMGWWDVRHQDGRVAARYVSEFQAWEAGRALAEQSGIDVMMRQDDGPLKYESYDAVTRTVRPMAAAPAAGSRERRLILLVEDAVDARELYAEYLNFAGFSVVTAINGHEAVTLARMLRPDLILMDVRMPGMDGLEATADLKRDPLVAHIPVVVITGDVSDETSARARQAGCAAFIPKPALPRHVATYITQFLTGEGAQQQQQL